MTLRHLHFYEKNKDCVIYFPQKQVHNSLPCDAFFPFIKHQLYSTQILSHLSNLGSFLFSSLSIKTSNCMAVQVLPQGRDNKYHPQGTSMNETYIYNTQIYTTTFSRKGVKVHQPML